MNCEAYIIKSEPKKTEFFPANIKWDKMRDLCHSAQEYEYMVIRRFGDIIYYIFLRQLVDRDGTYIGIGIALNNVVIADVKEMYRFFNREMRTLVCNYNLALYDKCSGAYHSNDRTPGHTAARSRLLHAFNTHFHNEWDRPGPQDYTSNPTADTININEDGQVVRILTGESKHAEHTIRQSIEAGNTLIVTSLMTDEQEIARLNKLINWYKNENKRLNYELGLKYARAGEAYRPQKPGETSTHSHAHTKGLTFSNIFKSIAGIFAGFILSLSPLSIAVCGILTWYMYFTNKYFAIPSFISTVVTYIIGINVNPDVGELPLVSVIIYVAGAALGYLLGKHRRDSNN